MSKAVILLWQRKFAKISHQIKKKILAGKVEFPMGEDDLPAFKGHWESETAR